MELEVTRAKVFSGVTWIKQGWKIFTLKPSVFMALSAIVVVISILPGLIPFANFIVLFLMPFISLGYYQTITNVEHGEKAEVPDVFQYLGKIPQYGVLLRVAAVSLLLSIPVTYIMTDMQAVILQEQIPPFHNILTLAVLMFLNAMLTVFAAPTAWVAPKTPLSVILKNSFKACWINAMPLTVYGLLVFIIATISMPFILIGWLIAYSLITISFLQAFLDIYQPVHKVNEPSEEATVVDITQANLESDDTNTDIKQ